jgi:ribosomal protein S18 acetylase RimI-like enzyme
MTEEDYDQVAALWAGIKGFAIRSIDDSREGITRFIRRNPTTSVVAVDEGRIVGSILCGHDGRQGCFYHVCVDEAYRKHGIGRHLVSAAIEALKAEHINKVYLIAFKKNEAGNAFWKSIGWTCRDERNYYDLILNEQNHIAINE